MWRPRSGWEPGAAAGQSSVPAHKWEVELPGGGMLAAAPVDGTGALPGPGPAITTPFTIPAGVSMGRLVSSWYFGDGASLLNLQFSTLPGVPSNLSGTPITSFKTFTGTGIEHHVNVTAGLFWRF